MFLEPSIFPQKDSFKDVSLSSLLDAFENCLFCAVNVPEQTAPLKTLN